MLNIAILACIALAHGICVGTAAGLVFRVLRTVPQLSLITGTLQRVRWYSIALLCGMLTACFIDFGGIRLHLPPVFLCLAGVGAGAYTGVFLSALVEALGMFTISSGKLRFKYFLRIYVWVLALAKSAGALLSVLAAR